MGKVFSDAGERDARGLQRMTADRQTHFPSDRLKRIFRGRGIKIESGEKNGCPHKVKRGNEGLAASLRGVSDTWDELESKEVQGNATSQPYKQDFLTVF